MPRESSVSLREHAAFIKLLRRLNEIHVDKDDYLDQRHTPLLGVTDSAVIALATKREGPVLTDDAMLYHWLQQAGLPALNFNHLRFERF